MGVGDRRPVDMQLFVDDLNRVPFHGRDALDEILVAVVRINEDNDIPLLRFLERQQIPGGKGNLDPEKEFVHQNMVADLQGGFHGPGGNLKRLDNKGADQHRQRQGDKDRLRIFPNRGFFLDFWIFQFTSPFGLLKTYSPQRAQRRAENNLQYKKKFILLKLFLLNLLGNPNCFVILTGRYPPLLVIIFFSLRALRALR